MEDSRKKLVVFIIDDDKEDIRIFNSFFRSDKIDSVVIEATNDKEIQDFFDSGANKPDVILLDYQMPGIGGLEWLKILKQMNIAPVIMLTGKGDEEIATETMKMGAIDYITKHNIEKYELAKTILNGRERWETQNERDSLLGITAHELRNPLSTIHGYVEILESQTDISKENINEIYTIIKGRCRHLLDIITQLLDITTIERGMIKVEKSDVNIIKIINTLIDEFRFRTKNKKIKFILDIEEQDVTLSIDPSRIEEVFSNLIDNAVKYSFPGSTVVIKVRKEDGSVVVSFADEGQGIREDEMKFIFELFSNVKISAKPTAGESSTGLGLAICKKLVRLHGGKISAESKFGEGSIFTVVLPVQID